MILRKYILLISVLFSLISCGSDSGGDDGTDPEEMMTIPPPSATSLIFPENNTECNEGENINEMQSRVTFRWEATENTDSYQVNIRNLNTNSITMISSLTTEIPILIQRGTPFEWFVISQANGTTETATSISARFFNQGPGIENFAPFPAEVVFPVMGSTVDLSTNNPIVLEWSSTDIDNDIINFEILFDTVNPPLEIIGESDMSSLETNAEANTIYFWQVISRDEHGNSSTSPVFQFRT